MKDKRHELIQSFLIENDAYFKQGQIVKAGFPESKNPRNLAMKRMYQDKALSPEEFDGIINGLKDLKIRIENFIEEAQKI